VTVRIARPFRFSERAMDRAVRLFHTCSMRLESLADYYREGLHLRVVCRCGRSAFLATGPLMADCHKRKASTRIEQIVQRLKCADCNTPPIDWGPA
jgi:hypothetical protein